MRRRRAGRASFLVVPLTAALMLGAAGRASAEELAPARIGDEGTTELGAVVQVLSTTTADAQHMTMLRFTPYVDHFFADGWSAGLEATGSHTHWSQPDSTQTLDYLSGGVRAGRLFRVSRWASFWPTLRVGYGQNHIHETDTRDGYGAEWSLVQHHLYGVLEARVLLHFTSNVHLEIVPLALQLTHVIAEGGHTTQVSLQGLGVGGKFGLGVSF